MRTYMSMTHYTVGDVLSIVPGDRDTATSIVIVNSSGELVESAQYVHILKYGANLSDRDRVGVKEDRETLSYVVWGFV